MNKVDTSPLSDHTGFGNVAEVRFNTRHGRTAIPRHGLGRTGSAQALGIGLKQSEI